MKIYVAVPTEIEDLTDPLSEIVFGETIEELLTHCEQFWNEAMIIPDLENVKTEVNLSGDAILLHVTGDDPEGLYIYTTNGHYDEVTEYKIKTIDTKRGW